MPDIQLTTLTPIHIGSGKEYMGNFEFVYFSKENKIAIIDDEKVFKLIGGKANIDEWVKVIDKKGDLLKFIKEHQPNVNIQDIQSKTIGVIGKPPKPQQTIKEFIQSATQNSYIPGSSLKGAIRTVVLSKLIKNEPAFAQQQKNLGFETRNGFKFKDKAVNSHYLGKDPNHDLLRLLQVSDFHTQGNTETICIQNNILNLFNNGWNIKQNQTSFVECLPANTNLKGKLHIPEELIKQIKEKSFPIKHIEQINLITLFKNINAHTLLLIKDEIEFWEDEDEPDILGDYINVLTEVEEQIQQCKENECVIRMSAGSGWDFMTGAWAKEQDVLDDKTWLTLKRTLRYKPYNDSITFPKTRKLLHQGQPLGFVKLNIQN